MPEIPTSSPFIGEERPDERGGNVVRVPITDIPVVEYGPANLPLPVRRLREQILEAAATGDPEKLPPDLSTQMASTRRSASVNRTIRSRR